jgi:hypothetical protein
LKTSIPKEGMLSEREWYYLFLKTLFASELKE